VISLWFHGEGHKPWRSCLGKGRIFNFIVKRNDPRCGSTCTRVAGSDWANWCRMLIICAAIEIARRGHSTTALSMGTYILARRSRYLFCGVCRSSLNFRALRPSTFIWCCPLGLCRFHVVARMWPLQLWRLWNRHEFHRVHKVGRTQNDKNWHNRTFIALNVHDLPDFELEKYSSTVLKIKGCLTRSVSVFEFDSDRK